jgi:hypothetical protein
MVSPSLCGAFLSDKRSLVAFTWTITTVLTVLAFLTAVLLVIQIHTHYHRMERYYESDDWYQSQYAQYQNDDNNNQNSQEENQVQETIEKTAEAYLQLASLSARSITFVPVYTMLLAVGLSWYGSTAIVGFTSLRGVYIAPCFSSGPNTMAVGIFGGAIVIFANLLLVCAVILGEVRVSTCLWNTAYDRTEAMSLVVSSLVIPCAFLIPSLSCLWCSFFSFILGGRLSGRNIHSVGSHMYVFIGSLYDFRRLIVFMLCQ